MHRSVAPLMLVLVSVLAFRCGQSRPETKADADRREVARSDEAEGAQKARELYQNLQYAKSGQEAAKLQGELEGGYNLKVLGVTPDQLNGIVAGKFDSDIQNQRLILEKAKNKTERLKAKIKLSRLVAQKEWATTRHSPVNGFPLKLQTASR